MITDGAIERLCSQNGSKKDAAGSASPVALNCGVEFADFVVNLAICSWGKENVTGHSTHLEKD